MTNVVIVGSGGLAAEISFCFENTFSTQQEEISIKGYIDYDYNIEKYWKRYRFDKPVISDIDNYPINGDEFFVVGIADINFRKMIIGKIKEKGGRFINLIHRTAMVPQNCTIGIGNIIGPYSHIGPNAEVGDFNVILAQSIISHDCKVGNNNVFAAAMLTGHVNVGSDNYFGARSTIIPHVTIGSSNIIQAGMVVDNSIGDDTVIFHRFKEKILAITKENNK